MRCVMYVTKTVIKVIIPMRVVKFCPECGAKILKMISGERVRYPWEGAKV